MMIMVDKILCKECFIFNGGGNGDVSMESVDERVTSLGYPFFALYYCMQKIYIQLCNIANHPQTIDVTDTFTRFSFTLPNHLNTKSPPHYYIKPLRKIMNNKDFKNKQTKSLIKH